jgi:hypothetical protein
MWLAYCYIEEVSFMQSDGFLELGLLLLPLGWFACAKFVVGLQKLCQLSLRFTHSTTGLLSFCVSGISNVSQQEAIVCHADNQHTKKLEEPEATIVLVGQELRLVLEAFGLELFQLLLFGSTYFRWKSDLWQQQHCISRSAIGSIATIALLQAAWLVGAGTYMVQQALETSNTSASTTMRSSSRC